MIPGNFLTFVPLLFGLFAGDVAMVGQSVSRVTVQDEIILRVPVQPRPLMPHIDWIERKGPKCLPANSIQRAVLSGEQQVDFILANRSRVRAELDEDCSALDFYGGFYLEQQDDRLCAGRDEIHDRIGASCRIHKFKLLTPKTR